MTLNHHLGISEGGDLGGRLTSLLLLSVLAGKKKIFWVMQVKHQLLKWDLHMYL